jgi:DNA-binding transcriptional MerR regulator
MSEFQLVSFDTIDQYERMAQKAAALQDELLTVSAVARRLGVAPATLRTWDRRYGLGPSTHEAGDHRRYCASDLAKLMLMRRLISAGVAPCDAAEQAKNHKGEIKFSSIIREFEVREDIVTGIDKALLAFDLAFVEETLRHEINASGVEITWHEIIVPTLIAIGEAWQSSGKGIEIEHAFTEVLKKVLRERALTAMTPINSNPVILASIGEEQHSLPLHALEAALAEIGISTYFLGARTPFDAIAATLPRIAPPAIFLWATFSQNARPEYFRDLPSIRPAPRILLGGPGWAPDQCHGATVVLGIGNACDEIASAVGVSLSR